MNNVKAEAGYDFAPLTVDDVREELEKVLQARQRYVAAKRAKHEAESDFKVYLADNGLHFGLSINWAAINKELRIR